MNIKAIDNNLSFNGRFVCTDIINESLDKANRREIIRFSILLNRMKNNEDIRRFALVEKHDELVNKSDSRTFVLKELSENKEICIFDIGNKARLFYSKILNIVNENLTKLYPKAGSKIIPTSVYQEQIKRNLVYDKPKKLFDA